MLLRPYQDRGVGEIRAAFNHGARRVLVVLPTGGGKTTIFSYITSAAAGRGNRVCNVMYRLREMRQGAGV